MSIYPKLNERQQEIVKNVIKIVVAIIFLISVAIGGFFWRGKSEKSLLQQQAQKQVSDMRDWKTYRNETYGFDIKYPESWVVDESDGTTLFPEVSYETKKLGIEEIANELLRQKLVGSIVVNISVYKDLTVHVGTLENWRKHDIAYILSGSAKEGRYYWKLFPFSAEKVLVFSERKFSNESIGIKRYYFFHNNEGYEVTAYYLIDDNNLDEKIISTLKIDN